MGVVEGHGSCVHCVQALMSDYNHAAATADHGCCHCRLKQQSGSIYSSPDVASCDGDCIVAVEGQDTAAVTHGTPVWRPSCMALQRLPAHLSCQQAQSYMASPGCVPLTIPGVGLLSWLRSPLSCSAPCPCSSACSNSYCC